MFNKMKKYLSGSNIGKSTSQVRDGLTASLRYVNKSKRGLILIAGLIIVLVLSLFYMSIPNTQESLATLSGTKDDLLVRRGAFTDSPQPILWEPGQLDTAIASQNIYFSNLAQSPEVNDPISFNPLQLQLSSWKHGVNLSKSPFDTSEDVNIYADQLISVSRYHYQMIDGLQNFIEFNCLAYLGGTSPYADQRGTVIENTMELISQTSTAIVQAHSIYSSDEYYQNTQDELSKLNKDFISFLSESDAESSDFIVSSCEQTQLNIIETRQSFWEDAVGSLTEKNSNIVQDLGNYEIIFNK